MHGDGELVDVDVGTGKYDDGTDMVGDHEVPQPDRAGWPLGRVPLRTAVGVETYVPRVDRQAAAVGLEQCLLANPGSGRIGHGVPPLARVKGDVPEPLELGGARTLDVDTDMSGIGEGDDREITCAREADVGRLSHRGGREQARSAVLVSAAARALVDQHDLRDRHVVKARRLSPEERVGWYGGVRDHEPTRGRCHGSSVSERVTWTVVVGTEGQDW